MASDHVAGTVSPPRGVEPVGRLLEVISLHVPRAFGSSIAEVLAGNFGQRHVVGDYGAALEGSSSEVRLGRPSLPPCATVIHGHFPAARYADLPACRRVTFVREPVRRTVSHFFSWLSQPKHGNPVHNRMLDEHLGLLDFAKLPAIRYFYSETIFGGCDMAAFDLVGIVEDLERDWPRFQRLTGIQAALPHLNPNRYPGYAEIAARVMADRALMRELRRILADDIRFYERFV